MRLPFDFASLDEANDQLNRPTFNERSFLTPLRGQTLQGLSMGSYVKANTTTFESWYVPGVVDSTVLTTVGLVVNTLRAIPFVAETPYILDGLGFNVTTVSGAGGKARVGIYDSAPSGSGLFYPRSRLVDGGEKAVDVGAVAKTTTGLGIELKMGGLYFAVYQCGVAAPTVRGVPVAALSPSLGFDATLAASPQVGYQVASTYSSAAGLPALFPAGATAVTGTMPAVYLRFAATATSSRFYPVYSPSMDGFRFRRSKILCCLGTEVSASGDFYFTIASAIRSGGSASVIDTFDSRDDKIQPGVPYPLADGDLAVNADDIVEIQVSQYGKPLVDLSDLVVQTDLLYGGS